MTFHLWQNVALQTSELGKIVDLYFEAGQLTAQVRIGLDTRKVLTSALTLTSEPVQTMYTPMTFTPRPTEHNISFHPGRRDPSAWYMEQYSAPIA